MNRLDGVRGRLGLLQLGLLSPQPLGLCVALVGAVLDALEQLALLVAEHHLLALALLLLRLAGLLRLLADDRVLLLLGGRGLLERLACGLGFKLGLVLQAGGLAVACQSQ